MPNASVHISVLLDRSGSMESIRDDTIGGFNAFLEQQKRESGHATMTVVQFDTQDAYEVLNRFVPIELVDPLSRASFVPRATTPLFDALGRAINDVNQTLDALKDENRPRNVIMVVVTDGRENSSREFSKRDVERMIQDKTASGWQFVYLSADLTSFSDARELGFSANSSMAFAKSAKGTARAWDSLSTTLSRFRNADARAVEFSDADRKNCGDEDNANGDSEKV